jgi:hypothetical protein
MIESTLEEELEHIQFMTIKEAVAYANRLTYRLNRNDYSDIERIRKLLLLERLSDRARFLRITLHPSY